MKRVLSIFVLMCLCVGLVGCSGSKPSDLSEDNYDLGIKILDAADKYLDGDLTADEAETKIDTLKGRIDTEDTTKASLLEIKSEALSYEILKSKNGAFGGSIKVVEEKRDEVAETLGK